ncbi:MAG: FAD-dependent thymidylate synthase [Thermomicrobiales bacterium]|nr:FAD-dependent thymidylate synthase [Thermomicrobiales bacterium]
MINDITLRSDMTVDLLAHNGNDMDIANAARVSVGDGRGGNPYEISGLINYLMKHRHGSPFEHGYLKFHVECPIFVAREFMRHRAGWSYNEVSGRYSVLEPVFWVPTTTRGIVNEGTSARPRLEPDAFIANQTIAQMQSFYEEAWEAYRLILNGDVVNEVARAVLPVGIYTSFIASCNPRSLMHFLSLRINHPDNQYDTYPQAEIQEVAEKMEKHFKAHWPLTWEAFNAHGRVSP